MLLGLVHTRDCPYKWVDLETLLCDSETQKKGLSVYRAPSFFFVVAMKN